MRKWNFCAGPAAIPEEVLRDAQNELLEWNLSGTSVMEVSHRSNLFAEVAASSMRDIKALLNIGDDHEVLFLQGGATLQFTSVPLNFTKKSSIVSYLNTGLWSKKAIKAASKYASVNVVASSEESKFTFVPNTQEWRVDPDSIYFHYVMNETIQNSIKDIVDQNDVVLFMKGTKVQPECGFSNAVVNALSFMNIEYKDVNVLESDELRQGIKDFTNWPTIPQLYVKGEFIGGCDIILDMHKTGELSEVLKEKNIAHD